MFKRRFELWHWSKYNSKRQKQDVVTGKAVKELPGRSCVRTRRPVLAGLELPRHRKTLAERIKSIQVIPMLHQNDTVFHLNMALAWTRQYLRGIFGSGSVGNFSTEGISNISQNLASALNYFFQADIKAGGRLLRRMFRDLKRQVLWRPEVSYVFWVYYPLLFCDLGYKEIGACLLKACFSLVGEDGQSKNPFLPLVQHLSPIVYGNSPEHYYLLQISRLWADEIGQFKGPGHLKSMRAQHRHILLTHAVLGNTDTKAVTGLIGDYEVALRHKISEFGELHATSMNTEDNILSLQHYFNMYSDNFAQRSLGYLAKLERVRNNSRFPLEVDYNTSKCNYRLMRFYCNSGMLDKALEIGRAGSNFWPDVNGSWWYNDYGFFFLYILQKAGKYEEAEECKRRLLDSKYYQDLEAEFADEEEEFLRNSNCRLRSEQGTLISRSI